MRHRDASRVNRVGDGKVGARSINRCFPSPDACNAFYGPDGKIIPIFRVHMDVQNEFAGDLNRRKVFAFWLCLSGILVADP